jgi:hypothetical protein
VIDFRYHVVSIIAVFLALTVGLVLGSSFLGHEILDNLHHQVNGLNSTNNQLRNQQSQLETELRYQQAAIQDLAPQVVRGELQDQSVALVVLPEAGGGVAGQLTTLIQQAGGDVETQVTLGATFTAQDAATQDPSSRSPSSLLAAASKQTRLRLPAYLEGGSPQQQVAAELTAALTERMPTGDSSAPTTGITTKQANVALNALKSAGVIGFNSLPQQAAQMIVVVGGDPNGDTGVADQDNAGYLVLLHALNDGEGNPVVAGTAGAAGAHGLIAAMLADNWTNNHVSSVDNSDTVFGQIAVVNALVLQESGHTGHYGMTGILNGPVPVLQPAVNP